MRRHDRPPMRCGGCLTSSVLSRIRLLLAAAGSLSLSMAIALGQGFAESLHTDSKLRRRNATDGMSTKRPARLPPSHGAYLYAFARVDMRLAACMHGTGPLSTVDCIYTPTVGQLPQLGADMHPMQACHPSCRWSSSCPCPRWAARLGTARELRAPFKTFAPWPRPHLRPHFHSHCPIMTLLTWAAAAFVVYLVGLALYRLYLSPLARSNIPGPKLGALSKFYEAYYEVVEKGQLSFKLNELHDRYGEDTLPGIHHEEEVPNTR